ncbi:hypothetical protein SAMN07250955_11639 [Arboricoccus pini]|uniref:Uncharacterized protein n=1 Tax=Arboricoccus pini TaxID=1963835 RepID=A0A212RX49_9PROT|nr:hypothetical protein [Arboricoccus pini]SNB77193.1 hypothetical protein SAMN07250955_11639 [Arboricoccus pini]
MSQTILRPVERSARAGNGLVHYILRGKDYPVLLAFSGPLEAIRHAAELCQRDFHLYGCVDGQGQSISGDDGCGGHPPFMLCHSFHTPLDILPPGQPGYWLAMTWSEIEDADFLCLPRAAPDHRRQGATGDAPGRTPDSSI